MNSDNNVLALIEKSYFEKIQENFENSGMTLEHADNLEYVYENVSNYQAILLDISCYPLEFVKNFHKDHPEIPVIVLIEEMDEKFVLSCIQSGAHDCLLKNMSEERLPIAVKIALKRVELCRNLLDSESRYQHLFENANVMIQSVDTEGRFIMVNKEWEEKLGYKREELNGITLFDIIDKECLEHCSEVFQKVVMGEPQKNVQAVFIAKDGHKVIVEGNAFSRIVDGKVLATHGIFRDVTEKARVREALMESENRYRTTFDNTGTAMAIVDENGLVSLINSEFERLSGYSKAEIEGKMNWKSFVHPDDIEMLKKYRSARMNGKEAPTRYEFRFVNRIGETKNVYSAVVLIPGTGTTICSLIDITQLKKVNKLLGAISEINELVAREKSPELVLKAVCEKMTLVYDAVFTSLISESESELIPIESRGIDISLIKSAVKRCPSILDAKEGNISKFKMDSKLCSHCLSNPHNYVLSLPFIHHKIYGVVTIHSSTDFGEDEIQLLQKLSRNIAFALSSYKMKEERNSMMEQLACNLVQFDKAADRLRNPLAAIMGSLELKEVLGEEKVLRIVGEQAKRIKTELDELRSEEIGTYNLLNSLKKGN